MNDLVKVENNKIIVKKEIINQIIEFEKFKAEMDLKEKHLKEALKEAFEKNGIKSWSTDGLSASYRAATTSTRIDSKRLKEELPDIYEEYSKTSNVSSSITLKID